MKKEQLQNSVLEYKKGNINAIEGIIEGTQGTTITLVKQYVNTLKSTFEDLTQESYVVLLEALEEYEKEKGALFNTFYYTKLNQAFNNIYKKNKCKKRDGISVSMDEKIKSKNDNLSIIDTLKSSDDIEEEVINQDMKIIINELIEKYINLYPKYTNIINGIYIKEKQLVLIAQEEDCNKSTITKINKKFMEFCKKEFIKKGLVY